MKVGLHILSSWANSMRYIARLGLRYRKILKDTSYLELTQRYAGSALGPAWIIIYPLVFLLIYLFLYMVVFRVRFPGLGTLNYVIYVFCGLVPYLIVMESVTRGLQVIKENIHLIKNVIMPIELIPVRLVIVSFLAQGASMMMMIALALFDGELSWRVIFLPVVLVLFAMLLTGVVYAISSLGVLFNDLTYIINLLMTALMFVSPIAFKPDMVPAGMQAVIYLNPVSYPLEAIRWSLLSNFEPNIFRLAAFIRIARAVIIIAADHRTLVITLAFGLELAIGFPDIAFQCMKSRRAWFDTHTFGDSAPAFAVILVVITQHVLAGNPQLMSQCTAIIHIARGPATIYDVFIHQIARCAESHRHIIDKAVAVTTGIDIHVTELSVHPDIAGAWAKTKCVAITKSLGIETKCQAQCE